MPDRLQLEFMLIDMVARYGAACQASAYADAERDRDAEAKWNRACHRRFRAVMRLARAMARA